MPQQNGNPYIAFRSRKKSKAHRSTSEAIAASSRAHGGSCSGRGHAAVAECVIIHLIMMLKHAAVAECLINHWAAAEDVGGVGTEARQRMIEF